MTDNKLVHRRFFAVAREYTDSPAIRFRHDGEWHDWSYASLVARVLEIQKILVANNVAFGDAVGVIACRHPDTIAAMIAILSAGAHFVPLDAEYPLSRLQLLVDDAGISVTVAAQRDSACLPELQGMVRLPFAINPAVNSQIESPAFESMTTDTPAYIMFTSGSTGTPKGVVVPHRAIIRLVDEPNFMTVDCKTVFMHLAPLSFDASTLEIWAPLLNGGVCVIYPDDMLPTRADLAKTIVESHVNCLWLTTSLFNNIFSDDDATFVHLEYLLTGGETASVAHIRRALEAMPKTQLINGYGPTENTTFTTCYAVPHDLPANTTQIPIGVPISGTDVVVVDDNLRPVSDGVEGELIALGDGLALGYLNRPELTDERFVVLDTEGGVRSGYRTGDRASVRADGSIDFYGRSDEQIKIEGHRIEPGEIEYEIKQLQDVSACRVLARKSPSGQIRLAAYIVSSNPALQETIRNTLAGKLPAYMIPQYFLFVDSLPTTANGKLDVAALPDLYEAPDAAPDGIADDELATVVRAWREILGTRPASNDINFFDAGGTSLEAVKLHETLCKRLGRGLGATFVFENPTIRHQFEALQMTNAAERGVSDRGARRRAARPRRARAKV